MNSQHADHFNILDQFVPQEEMKAIITPNINCKGKKKKNRYLRIGAKNTLLIIFFFHTSCE